MKLSDRFNANTEAYHIISYRKIIIALKDKAFSVVSSIVKNDPAASDFVQTEFIKAYAEITTVRNAKAHS